MKIEVLFPEFCNLYGDISNITYLKKCLPDAEFIETEFNSTPKFVTEEMDLIYLGPMTERMQEKVIEKFMEYKERLKELIDQGTNFLFTGNSFEILGKEIENEDGSKIEALGLIPIISKRDMFHRFNDMILGEFYEMKIVGFKSQFTQSYGDNRDCYFLKNRMGAGLNKQSSFEGVKINNFIGTYLLGPILILNPLFTKYLLNSMGVENPKLAFEEEIMKAYEKRLKEFERLVK